MVGAKLLSLSWVLASAFAAPSVEKRGGDDGQSSGWGGQAGKPLSGTSVSTLMLSIFVVEQS